MPEEKKPEKDNGKKVVGQQAGQGLPPPKDFKIAEIWIKNDTVALDACPNFWMDKLRAVGILEYCKEIVKTYNPADQRKKSLIKGINMQGFRNFIRGRK